MELITNKKQLIGTELFERDLSEIKDNLKDIIDLIEKKHLISEGNDLFVVQLYEVPSGVYGDETMRQVCKWRLVDWYLACDTDSQDMTIEELEIFKSIGGKIRS